MTTLRWLLGALGWRRFRDVDRPERSHAEMERVRERQRDILARVEALGVQVDVRSRNYSTARSYEDVGTTADNRPHRG